MRVYKYVVLIGLWGFLLLSCTSQGSLRYALAVAEDNKVELERVLDWYKQTGEKEKYEAAVYLLKNMPSHHSYSSSIEEYYKDLDSFLKEGITRDDFISQMDSLYRSHKEDLVLDNDIRVISSSYLIEQIDSAYYQWKYGKWAKHLSFEEFCEYLLPYKCVENQPMDDWRIRLQSYSRGAIDTMEIECKDYRSNAKVAAFEVNKSMPGAYLKYTKKLEIYPIYKPEILLRLPYGTCIESCAAALQVQRSKGIPVSIDYTPQWPNRKYGHYWMTVLNNKKINVPFAPFDIEPDIQQERMLSKVYRMTFAPDKELTRRLKKGWFIPNSLRYIFFKDVSQEYMKTEDVVVDCLKGTHPSGNIYIATYNNQEWIPVATGEKLLFRNKISFKKIGRDVLYLPVCIDSEGRQKAIGLPFYLDLQGKVNYIKTDAEETESLCVDRKYPVYEFVYRNAKKIRGGVIEISSSPRFINPSVIASIPLDTLMLGGMIRLKTPIQGRYFRFRASNSGRCDMAEIKFYDNEGNEIPTRLIKCGREVNPNNKVNLATAINDNDPLTFFSARGEDDIWVGFDMGNTVTISQISYFRRSDGNNLFPGYEYTLSYWNNTEWETLSRQTIGTDIRFILREVPKNALLLLKCNTTGTESRPFIYNGGKIIWY